MLEKLLSLLLHAKGGAVATVLVLGASGALVTATVENGMTTVTITQPSQSSTGSEVTTGSNTTTTNNTVTQQILALFNRTHAEDDVTPPATGNGCKDAAHATNEQVKRVNEAFKKDHAAVRALSKDAPKTDAARTLVRTADGKVKDWRQVGVKAIHELFKSDECKGNDDEDNDEDEDNDDEDDDTVAISCTDAKACADAAIKAMDDEVANLKTALAALPATTTNTTTTNRGEKAKTDHKSGKDSHDNKGKGNSGKGSHDNDEDDD